VPPTGVRSLDPRTPVLVGVGTASDDAQAVELMARALVAAGSDAGSAGLVAMIDRIAVPQGSWTALDPGRLVAGAVGAPEARTHLSELGIPQQTLINQAVAALLAGESAVAAVVGGEAKRWARDRAAEGEEAEIEQPGAAPDVVHRLQGSLMEPVEVAHRLWDPVQQYAMIDNALRAADGLSPREHRTEIAVLWEAFNRVARANPLAAFPTPMDAHQIDTPSAGNRPLAFPYNKWHSTQWTVNQAAALLFCTIETAMRMRVPPDRWIFPLVGIESSQAVSLLRRSEPHTWPAMEVLGRAAAVRMGRPVSEVEVVEAYSCFPAAVRVQQRALGLDRSSAPPITGGMAFAGGPFNNFVMQATAAVVARLRDDPGSLGAVTTVSGLLTKPGLGIWSGSPDDRPPLLADLAGRSESETGTVDVVATLDGYRGEGTVVTYTATFEGLEPVRTVALFDTTDGRRCVAVSVDSDLAAQAIESELIGTRARIGGGSFAPV
jgi:acetyl-CoA C-acetyltransferase